MNRTDDVVIFPSGLQCTVAEYTKVVKLFCEQVDHKDCRFAVEVCTEVVGIVLANIPESYRAGILGAFIKQALGTARIYERRLKRAKGRHAQSN